MLDISNMYIIHQNTISWVILVLGGLCEAGWAYCLNRSKLPETSITWLWYAMFLVLYILSAICLDYAVRQIPVGTAYAVWTGIGAVGTIVMGILVFNEPVSVLRLVLLFVIFASIIGLKLISE